jgi:hypothetical protein
LSTAQVNFWHAILQGAFSSDEMNVYYKTSTNGDWHFLANIGVQAGSNWIHDSLGLPNLSSEYYIAFEGSASGGPGVCLDDVKVKTTVGCSGPADMTETVVSTTATLNWSETGGATEWEIEYGLSGFQLGNGNRVSSLVNPTYTITNLQPLYIYDWYVRSWCSPNDSSAWSNYSSFTAGESLIALPVFEDFETGLTLFDNESGNDQNWGINSSLSHGGSQCASNAYGQVHKNILAESGIMDLSATTLPTLSFWHIANTESGHDLCRVEISTDGGASYSRLSSSSYQSSSATYSSQRRFDKSSYSAWSSGSPDNTWWQKEIFYLNDYKSNQVKIRFRLNSDNNTNYGTWYIDDILIEEPDCPRPVDQSVGIVTSSSAELSWTELGSTSTWQIEYGLSGFSQGSGTVVAGIGSNPYTLAPLVASTDYDWYVRSDCGAGGNSTWLGPDSFSTPCAAVSIPYLEDFEGVGIPNIPSCMVVENTNGDGDQWTSSDWYFMSGTNSARINGSASAASNDWLFTKGLQLTGGVTYECGFAYFPGSGYVEKLEVKWGTGASSSNMNGGSIWSNTNINNSKFELGSGTFTPSTTGVYYIGFHGLSDINKQAVYIDDIYVLEVSANSSWSGTTNGSWWTATNWTNSILPTSQTNVEIPVGLTNYPTLDHLSPCNNFTLKSNASGEASIIGEKYIRAKGQITVERYLSGGKWHLVSSPVDGATVNSFFFNHSPDLWIIKHDEATDTWTYLTDVNISLPFGAGYGAWVKTGNNVTVNLTGDFLNDDLFMGSWSNPPINYSGATKGYNLVGNPFPSALDWDLPGWDRTGIDGSAWVWNDASGNYAFRNSLGQGSLTNGIIPKGQGFFIHANDINNSFGIMQDARVHSSQSFYKSTEEEQSDIPHIIIREYAHEKQDEVWVSFKDEYQESYDDGRDVKKLFSQNDEVSQIFINNKTENLSICAIPMKKNDTRSLALYLKVGVDGPHQLELFETVDMETTEIFLEDKMMNIMQNFKMNPIYSFDAGINDSADRFILHFNNEANGVDSRNNSEVDVYFNDGELIVIRADGSQGKPAEIKVFDLSGRELITLQTSAQVSRFPLKLNLSVYVVNVKELKGAYSFKVIVQ